MGFIRGVFAGIAVAVGAAAWYMSRAGTKFRDRYRVDRRLGEIGDEIEVRTRDVRAMANAQLADVRDMASAQVADVRDRVSGAMGNGMASTLDDAQARAAEEAAEMAADVEAKAAKIKRAAKSVEADAVADAEADAEG
jgi:hypothetical protein